MKLPEIIDNRKFLLKDVINHIIKKSTHVKIAAGYFYLNGFDIVKDNINPNCILDIVIGVETDRKTAETIKLGYDAKLIEDTIYNMSSDLSNLDINQIDKIYSLFELIKEGRVKFKIYTKDKFHSKGYIFDITYCDDYDDSIAIVGSSNFSKRGLGETSNKNSNTELNAVLKQPSAVKEVKEWFDDIWNESQDFNIELLKIIENNLEFNLLANSPFDIILKSLYMLYKESCIFNDVSNSINLDELADFQKIAVNRAISILNIYNGVIIADSVGLGKTYIAKGILKHFSQNNLNALIICPASLKNNWIKECKSLDSYITIISQEYLGKNGLDYNLINNIQVILIDEAHNFRNNNAERFKELIKVSMGKKIIELTATPINNSVLDLYNIMTLFLKEDEFKIKYGISKLENIFKDYDTQKDKVNTILSEIMIRRSRSFIKKKYGKDNKLIVNGKEFKFPKRHIKTINYSLSSVYGSDIFFNIALLLENLNLPIVSLENISITQENNAIGLMKKMLLKRFESSVYSFKESILKQRNYCSMLLTCIDNGFLIPKEDCLLNESIENIDDRYKIYTYEYTGDISSLSTKIINDFNDFNDIINMIDSITPNKDIKLQTLISILNSDLYGKKVIIFTEFRDTAVYLKQHLTKSFSDLVIEEIDSKSNFNKQQIVSRFAPKANDYELSLNEKEIDILITTDILSEGQNLQDCNILINYDLTWNPVRIIQREGRIDRITTEHNNIYISNFMPENELDKILNLVENINRKISYINSTVGNESKILTNDEIITEKTFNDNSIDDDTENLRKMINSDNIDEFLDELETESTDLFPSEEYMQDDYRSYILNNSLLKNKAKNLPDAIYSIKKCDKHSGVYMYFKSSYGDYWLLYDNKTDKFITNKEYIYAILSEGNNLKSKPLNRTFNFDTNIILEKGRCYVESQIKKIINGQLSISEISLEQKYLAERVNSMLLDNTKYRIRLSKELKALRRKLKTPLHKGTLLKIKSLNIEEMDNDTLALNLNEILGYLNDLPTNINTFNDIDINLICYEILI